MQSHNDQEVQHFSDQKLHHCIYCVEVNVSFSKLTDLQIVISHYRQHNKNSNAVSEYLICALLE